MSASQAHKRPPIDTRQFMARYHHPKNIAAARGDHQDANNRATITTSYSKATGLYRQKQVDNEIARIRAHKKPSSSSKITVTISPTNLLSLYHYHHHCLDVQLTSRCGKGRVVWFWDDWETATDERVIKGAIAALDSSWNEDTVHTSSSSFAAKRGIADTMLGAPSRAAEPNGSLKRKRAACSEAAESRQANTQNLTVKQKVVEVIDLVGPDDSSD